MTHLPARDADALTTSSFDAFAPPPLARNLMDDTVDDSHDRVMLVGSETDSGAGSAFLMHTTVGSCCSACDLETRWQSDPRQPTLHLSVKGFDATDGAANGDAVQVNPFNPDITPNEWSGR